MGPVLNAGGIGGTGMLAQGGIGGTGMLAKGGIGGTGIVGTITGFASVCINGLEVDYDDSTRVNSNGEAADIHKLAVGQVIAIDAVGGTNRLHAHRIDILNAVEGSVTAIKTEAGLIEIMGQKIRLDNATLFEGVVTTHKITVGMPLKVSGYRNSSSEIVATRIEAAKDIQDISIIGTVEQSSAGQYFISGTPIASGDPSLATGLEVLVKGTWDGQKFHASSVQHDPSLPFVGHASRVVVEGLVLGRTSAHQIKISGFDIDFSGMTSLEDGSVEQLMQGHLVRVVGHLQPSRHLQADHIEIMRRSGTHSVSGLVDDAKNAERSAPMQMENGMMSHQNEMVRPMPSMLPNSPMPAMRPNSPMPMPTTRPNPPMMRP